MRRGCGARCRRFSRHDGAERRAAFQAITEDKYEIIQAVGDAAIVIKNTKEPPLTLTIHLTSPVVREEMEKQLAGGTARGGRPRALRAPQTFRSVPFRFPPGEAPQRGPRWDASHLGGGPRLGEFRAAQRPPGGSREPERRLPSGASLLLSFFFMVLFLFFISFHFGRWFCSPTTFTRRRAAPGNAGDAPRAPEGLHALRRGGSALCAAAKGSAALQPCCSAHL